MMTDNIQPLEKLVHLAKESSPERRRDLLRKVTDLFFKEPESLNEREIGHIGDIICKIACDMEIKVRRHLAEKLSASAAAPHQVMTMLANDEIDVAHPVLRNSTVLRTADLIDIIERRGQEYMLAISKRDRVSEEVADSLVEHGNDDILVSLAGNDGAEFSRDAMEVMVVRSKDNEALHSPLVEHTKMPPELVSEMFWHVSSALRRRILSMDLGLDETEVDEMLHETKTWLEEEGADQEELSPSEKLVLRKEKMGQLDTNLIEQFMRQGKIPELVAGIARLLKIDGSTARNIIFDEGGETLVIACKAIGLEKATFSNLLALADVNRKRSQQQIDALQGIYGRMTAETARRTIRFWRTRRQVMKAAAS